MTHSAYRESPEERRARIRRKIADFLISSLIALILFAVLYAPSIITGPTGG